MPIKRYSEFNQYLLWESGVGADIEAIQRHYTRLFSFLALKEIDNANKEAENLFYTHYAILEKIDFKSLAFACLVHSVGESVRDDYSEEGLKATAELVAATEITIGNLETSLEEVKKKITEDLERYFPETFPQDQNWEFFGKLKKQLLYAGRLLSQDDTEPTPEEIETLNILKAQFIGFNKPYRFTPDHDESVTYAIDRTFGTMCAMLESNGGHITDETTCFEFYAKINYYNVANAPANPV